MPSNIPYVPTFDFPSDPEPPRRVNDVALQAELRAVADAFAQLQRALSRAIRDDDTLVDQLVRLRNLHPELTAWLQSHIDGTVATESIKYTYPVRVVATSNLPALSGPATIDGVSVVTGDRVLLTGQTIKSQNGIYIVDTTQLWSRAQDLPHGAAADPKFGVVVSQGVVHNNTAWRLIPAYVTGQTAYVVGVDDIEFVQVFGPFPLSISRGGTGASTAAGARANLQVPIYHIIDYTIPNPPSTAVTFAVPVLDCRKAIIQVFERLGTTQQKLILADIVAFTNSVTISLVTPPPTGTQIRVIIIGV